MHIVSTVCGGIFSALQRIDELFLNLIWLDNKIVWLEKNAIILSTYGLWYGWRECLITGILFVCFLCTWLNTVIGFDFIYYNYLLNTMECACISCALEKIMCASKVINSNFIVGWAFNACRHASVHKSGFSLRLVDVGKCDNVCVCSKWKVLQHIPLNKISFEINELQH